MNNTLSLKNYALALGTVVVLAAGAVGLSAMFAHASVGPTVTVKATNASNAVVTSAPIGSMITAGVTVSSSTSAVVPTGTASFTTFANQSCTGTSVVQSNVALVNGMASSSATAMTATGLSYIVNYNGDATNTPSVSSCVAVAPTSASVTITNGLSSNSVVVGTAVTANAALANVTSAATGTVAYTFYTNNTCTLATTSPAAVTVANGVVPTSAGTTFNVPGTYYLQTVYSGDQSNAASSTACGSQVLTVNAVAATTGTITVDEVTSPAASSTNFQFNTTGTGYTTFALTDTAAPNVQTLAPGVYTITQPTVAGWTLSSATCSVNGSTGGTYTPGSNLTLTAGGNIHCTFTDTTNVVNPTNGPGTISGTFFNDLNNNDVKDGSDTNLAGWTVWLHTGNNYNGAIVATAVTDANGNYSFANLANGSYFVEEQEKAGWTQTTDDTAVTLNANAPSAVVNFANITSATSTGTGNHHDGKGKHNHDKGHIASTTPMGGHGDNDNHDNHDNDDDNNNGSNSDNGNHNGWFNGLTHGLKIGWFNHKDN